jgi:FHA domain
VPIGLTFQPGARAPRLGVKLSERLITLGRAPSSLVRLPDATVSDDHATLRRRGAMYLVEDLGSANGTFVVAPDAPLVRLAAGTPRIVRDGDKLMLGRVEIEVSLAADPPEPVTWLESPEALPAGLVAGALAALGLACDGGRVQQALGELWLAPVELLAETAEAPPPGAPPADVVLKDSQRLDWAIGALALTVASLAGLGLVWLLHR